jgi:hypothetical protein
MIDICCVLTNDLLLFDYYNILFIYFYFWMFFRVQSTNRKHWVRLAFGQIICLVSLSVPALSIHLCLFCVVCLSICPRACCCAPLFYLSVFVISLCVLWFQVLFWYGQNECVYLCRSSLIILLGLCCDRLISVCR